jgi:stearoyl-CoA desaturase (Delta-9 desaturase)
MDRPLSAPAGISPRQFRPTAELDAATRPQRFLLAKLMTLIWVFLLPGFGAIAAVVTIAQNQVRPIHLVLLLVGWVATGLGVTVGYHRLLTHQSFETHPVIKFILLALGSMAVEGPAIMWVANHMKHHAFSDQEGDPHTPKEGILHAHWGWLFTFSAVEMEQYASHVINDRVTRWASRTFILWVILSYVVPFLVAGWEGLIWGGFFRQFFVQNVTFAVNSVCHRWGARPFKTTDLSRNNWVVGILGLGEGWHNNHHAFPASAFHGMRWWEFDLSGRVIRMLETMKLAWNVRRPDQRMMALRLFEPATSPAYARVGK